MIRCEPRRRVRLCSHRRPWLAQSVPEPWVVSVVSRRWGRADLHALAPVLACRFCGVVS